MKTSRKEFIQRKEVELPLILSDWKSLRYLQKPAAMFGVFAPNIREKGTCEPVKNKRVSDRYFSLRPIPHFMLMGPRSNLMSLVLIPSKRHLQSGSAPVHVRTSRRIWPGPADGRSVAGQVRGVKWHALLRHAKAAETHVPRRHQHDGGKPLNRFFSSGSQAPDGPLESQTILR
ncbi:hypothetical protein BJX66DRAFT_173735 [Aspergillus keveii]|uniref:Uncharacterized protein n=1 Tax=Aspergillus keveii TaxID=714993 RepID=A0ABR4FHA3_9EURO